MTKTWVILGILAFVGIILLSGCESSGPPCLKSHQETKYTTDWGYGLTTGKYGYQYDLKTVTVCDKYAPEGQN
jgi:hypothetical protein